MEMESGKLFIGGISWDTNEHSLREYFHSFGEVVEAVIMKDRTTGRNRGFGFVVFAEPAVAERVVKEKHMIDGRTVEAKKAVPRDDQQTPNRNNGSFHGSPGPTRTRKIFVGGLASTVTEIDFKNYFNQFGTITDVVVMYDHNTQRPRGFGFITFDSEEAVDRVLLRTFHELNGKMVEVKRAVPKELSPGSTRSPLGGHNYGTSRIGNLLNAYTQGYNPSSAGGYGVRLDGRFSPARSGYPLFSTPAYGVGPNFETGMGPNFGTAGNLISNLNYSRGLNSYQNGSPNRHGSPAGYGIGSGGNDSVLSSNNRNSWGDGSFSYAKNSTNSGVFMGSGTGTSGLVNAFGSIGPIWGSSPMGSQNRGTDSAFSTENISFDLGGGGYASNTRSNVGPTRGGNDGAFHNFYGGGLVPNWRSSSPELESSGSFGYGLGIGNAVSDVSPRNDVRYVGGYSVTNRANRGIAT